ncbi:hypothetical protein PE067_20915 [Paracoccus sp. DMF-8]|uniref:hypothetical protein n=1 Tax=Paracoccus sp. DMF-8 TaxID=3019445 RepID=UPI0023E46C06|nr:hypothetical protein [Paracoccus sp. DMF-8]MDF3608387.1 hypothetical protein [Paracoccus sp. DMF-8]
MRLLDGQHLESAIPIGLSGLFYALDVGPHPQIDAVISELPELLVELRLGRRVLRAQNLLQRWLI